MAVADVTEFLPDLYPGLSRIPARVEVGSSLWYMDDSSGLFACYGDDGEIIDVQDTTKRGGPVYPLKDRGPAYELQMADALIYFIQAATGEIKIGMAKNVSSRLKTLQVANPSELVVRAVTSGGPKAEQLYHERFKAHSIRGEWFSPHEDILAEIARLSLPPAGEGGVL